MFNVGMSNESGISSKFTQPYLQLRSLQKLGPFVRIKEFFGRFVRNRNSGGGAPERCMKGYCALAYNQLQIIHKLDNSPSWEGTSCPAAQEILSSLLYLKVHYSQPLVYILNQMNPIHIFIRFL
jgi:hypothetical protein